MITVSAPGKLMLMGGHAVVYGRPCLVTAVDRRLLVSVRETDDGKITIDAPQVNDTRFVERAIDLAGRDWKIQTHGLWLHTDCPFSGKYGLGSSAAVVVATLKALAALFQHPLDTRRLFEAAYKVIMEVQGVGSGFDAAAAAWGGTLYFVQGGKVVEPLDGKTSAIPLVVGYSGVKSSSVSLVKQVASLHQKYPEKVERIMSAIGKLVDQAKPALLAGDWEKLGKLMDFNQEYLCDLGVSSPKLEDLISSAKKAGAWGAKLSGAGGGDCMISLVPAEKRQKAEQAIVRAGGEMVEARPHAPGARVETTDDQVELFVVVDRHDNIIGYRPRGDCHRDKSLIHRSVGVVIFDQQGRALLQKRSLTKDLQPGLWGISAAGHVAKGETYEESMRRELKEELGIELPMQTAGTFMLSDTTETEMSQIFTARSNGPFVPNAAEVARLRFVGKQELPRLLLSREIVLTTWARQALKEIGFLS